MLIQPGNCLKAARRAILVAGCTALFAAPVMAGGATTPTFPALPEPAVYEYRIERTSEPLSLVTDIPPPSARDMVPKTRVAPTPKATPPVRTPAPERSTSHIPRVPTRETVALSPTPKNRDGALRVARITPRPTVDPRLYPDRVTLTTGKGLRCRIIADKAGSLSVELEGGVVLDLPKRRIAKIERKFWAK